MEFKNKLTLDIFPTKVVLLTTEGFIIAHAQSCKTVSRDLLSVTIKEKVQNNCIDAIESSVAPTMHCWSAAPNKIFGGLMNN